METITLRGGPADGKSVDAPPCLTIAVPAYVPAKRQPTDDDAFWLDPFRYVDPDCNPTFESHLYDGRTGEYLGVK